MSEQRWSCAGSSLSVSRDAVRLARRRQRRNNGSERRPLDLTLCRFANDAVIVVTTNVHSDLASSIASSSIRARSCRRSLDSLVTDQLLLDRRSIKKTSGGEEMPGSCQP
jgi:hypothetical protein